MAFRVSPRGDRACILFVHNRLTPFVKIDRDLLAARFDVDEYVVARDLPSSSALWSLWRRVRACDVVYCWFASAHSLPPALVGRLMGKGVIVVVGGYDTANMRAIGYGHQRGGLKKVVAKLTMHLASRLLTYSTFTRSEAMREAAVSPSKITVLPLGVPPVDASVKTVPVDEGRLVLTVGRVDRPNLYRKGLEPFVRAAALAPHHRFVLVGAWDDDAAAHLRALATPNVTLTGAVDEATLHSWFRQADVYVQASTHEGFGLALAEAMAAGCIPVVTRAGSLPEVVGDAGIYADSASPADLVRAIEQAIVFGPALGERSRERVTTLFTVERRAAGLVAEVLTMVGRHDIAPSEASRDAVREAAPGLDGAHTPSREAGAAYEPRHGSGIASTGMDKPFVSVVIPTRNEARSIEVCLRAVLAQDYPPERFEVLVVDGESSDKTRALVAEFTTSDPHGRVRMLPNPRRIAASALNIGIQEARGTVIARVDGHTTIALDYLSRCVAALEETGAANVGGLMRARAHGYAGRCIALATGSRFGIGNSCFHYDKKGGAVDTVYLGCFRRAVFARTGLFDEALERNQDDEMNNRIRKAGERIWLDPAITSVYENRSSFIKLWRQYYLYGYWKAPVLRRDPSARRLRHTVPPALVAGLLVSALTALLLRRRVKLVPAALLWGAYGLASVGASARVSMREGGRVFPGVLLSFWVLHLAYGSGYLASMARGSRHDRACVPSLRGDDGE